MRATYIDYRDTNSFSSTVISYLEHNPKLAPFISQKPTIHGFKALLENKTVTANRHTLVNVLKRQYDGLLSASPAVAANIELLPHENTYTITTGHQLNIFTGPLYFIYKIVTAINLSVQLKAEFPDRNFVPVYWMATEDHDFAEINHTNIHGKKIVWDSAEAGATGRMSTASMQQTINAYVSSMGLSDNSSKLAQVIRSAYQDHKNLSDATRYLVNELFKEYGLVVIDADDVALKQQLAPYIERDILEQNSFREINSTTEKLNQAGFHTQVHAREINFFYLLDGLRERISFENGLYYVLNSEIRFTPDELKQEIHSHPGRFSPNVVLRPLYQEIILPNLAYIGGGAEVVYWLQLKQNFDFYGTDFPILILRNSAMIADQTIEQKLARIGLRLNDLFTGSDELKKNWIIKNTEKDLQLAQEWEELKAIFEKIKSRASQIDRTLSASTEAVQARLHRQITNLEKKLLRAEKRNHSTALSQIDSIKEKLFPGGGLQERSENFGSFYVKHGEQFIHELVRHFKPLDFEFTILS